MQTTTFLVQSARVWRSLSFDFAIQADTFSWAVSSTDIAVACLWCFACAMRCPVSAMARPRWHALCRAQH
eukprot:3091877-Rhodomonas_salina.4